MSDFLQSRVKKAVQARTDDAYWNERSQFQSPEHRDAFEKWFDKEYGGALDVGYYRTGKRNDKLRMPTSEEYYTAKNQFDYDRKGLYPDLNYDPFRRDKLENEAWKTYLKTRGYQNFDEKEFNRTYNRLKYKDQYDMSIAEDAQAYETGDKPYRYQMSEKAANEYKQLLSDIDNGTLGKSWREKYKTLAAYDAYALNAAKEAAAAKAKEDKRRQDALDNGETYTEPFTSPLTGTKKAKSSPLDLDTLKELGWDENAGFSWIDQAIIGRQQAINDRAAAAKAPAAMPTPQNEPKFGQPGMPNFRQLESATNNALDRPVSFREAEDAANAGIAQTQTPTGPNGSETREQRIERYRREAMGVWGGRAPDWIPDWLIEAAGAANEYVTPNLPQNLAQTYAIDTASTGLKNAYDAARNVVKGEPMRWHGNLTASGWKNAPTVPQWVIEDAQKAMAENPTDSKAYQDAKWAVDLASSPVGGAILGVIGDALFDPTTYVGAAEVAQIVKFVKAGKLDDAAKLAQKLSRAEKAMGGIKSTGPSLAPARPIRPTIAPNTAQAAPRVARAATIDNGPTIGKNTSMTPRELVRTATEPRNVAAVADDAATLTGKPTKQMDIGTPGQSQYDLQRPIPEGMKERGVSENIRTDANSPAELRTDFANDPLLYEVAGNKDTLARAESSFKDMMAKGDWDEAIEALTQKVERLDPDAAPLAVMMAREARLGGDAMRAKRILSIAAEKATRAGQYGQAFNILREADPETVMLTLERQLKKLNADGLKVYGQKRWKDFDLLPDELDEIGKLQPGDKAAFESAMEKIRARIADQMPSTALEKLTAWRHMAMLLNPKTHIRNIAGNALMAGLNRVSSRVSGVFQKALPKPLRTAAPIVRREAKQLAADFFAKHQDELLTGGNKYNEGIGLNMQNKRVFRGKVLEATRKFNYKALDVEDKFFFKRAYTDRLASALQARGIKSLDDIPQDILKLAVNEAEKAVFRDQSWLASRITEWKGKKGGAIVDAFMPFTKTPINIAKRGMDYSPIGIGKGIKKLFKAETVAEGIDDLAKGLTGTGVMGLGYLLADAGILTGAAPKDKDLAAYEKNTGNMPFEFTPLGITYDWAQPAAIPLAVGVAIHDALQEDPQAAAKLRRAIESGDTETANKLAGFYGAALLDGFKAAGDTMFNMSVLQGIQDLFGDPQGITAGLAKLPANFVNQAVPTIVGQTARSIDPTVRQTYYGQSNPADFLRTQTATVLNKIPGASTLLPPKVTPFGKDQRGIDNPIIRTISSFLNPGNTTTPQEIDPQVDKELRRLHDLGQLKQFPTTVDRTFKFMDKAVSLTDAEYAQYQRTTGQETIKAFKDIINSDEYRQIPKKELNEKLKALAATRGTTVQVLRSDSKVLDRIQEEYRAFLLAKGIQYAKALGQLEILRERGVIGNLTDKQLADRMGVSKEIAGKIN
jgi:hypothetical protein